MSIDIMVRYHGGVLAPANSLEAQTLEEALANNPHVFKARLSQSRMHKFHNKVLVLFRYLFNLWEPGADMVDGVPVRKDFDSFREHLTIRAGYFEQVFKPEGGFEIKAKSISWGAMENLEFEQLYSRIIDIGLGLVGDMKHLSHKEVERAVDSVLRGHA